MTLHYDRCIIITTKQTKQEERKVVVMQNLFTEKELEKVTNPEERKHLIECAEDNEKIDLEFMRIMEKYNLFQ